MQHLLLLLLLLLLILLCNRELFTLKYRSGGSSGWISWIPCYMKMNWWSSRTVVLKICYFYCNSRKEKVCEIFFESIVDFVWGLTFRQCVNASPSIPISQFSRNNVSRYHWIIGESPTSREWLSAVPSIRWNELHHRYLGTYWTGRQSVPLRVIIILGETNILASRTITFWPLWGSALDRPAQDSDWVYLQSLGWNLQRSRHSISSDHAFFHTK